MQMHGNGRLIIVCPNLLSSIASNATKRKNKWQQNIVLCKICGWECVGETIPHLNQPFHICMQLLLTRSILSIFSFSVYLNLLFSWLHLLVPQKFRRERNWAEHCRGDRRGKHGLWSLGYALLFPFFSLIS